MLFRLRRFSLAVFASALAFSLPISTAGAQTVPLDSVMDTSGRLSESAVTGSFGEIGLDPNGLYDINNPGTMFGSVELFPNDEFFGVGSLQVSGVSGSGIETVPVDSLDLGSLWASGSSTTDISDVGLGL